MAILRKPLQHVPPAAVHDSWFSITICCRDRAQNQLCLDRVAAGLIEAAVFYQRQSRWTLHIFLLMPDHLHMIASFPHQESMSEVIRSWKRATARRHGIVWQRNYFDHRVRPEDGLQQKTDYIRQNPVRAGLVSDSNEWPHFVDYNSLEGR
jgi:putative transposase